MKSCRWRPCSFVGACPPVNVRRPIFGRRFGCRCLEGSTAQPLAWRQRDGKEGMENNGGGRERVAKRGKEEPSARDGTANPRFVGVLRVLGPPRE